MTRIHPDFLEYIEIFYYDNGYSHTFFDIESYDISEDKINIINLHRRKC